MNAPEITNASTVSVWNAVPWEPSNPVRKEAVYFESLPSYDTFFKEIFLKNQLCILGPYSTDAWTSRDLWVSKLGTPDTEFLKQHFGKVEAPVTDCNADACSSNRKREMTVSDFIEYWTKCQADGHPTNGPCLYLKDWHFTRDFPSFCAYSPPSLLCSDWLNEFWDVRQDGTKGDDYRFVYMGPKNTWTPFHSDVLRSYSWSANICGRKKWIFYPPGVEDNLRDGYGQLVHDLRDPQLKDSVKYPLAKSVSHEAIIVTQHPGEIMFVPSGWHHQVFNLEDTISINHNWINGASAHLTWSFLKSQLSKVKTEISDCADMDGFDTQCQKILKADIGMHFVEFHNFMTTIARHRISALDVFCRYQSEIMENNYSCLPIDNSEHKNSDNTNTEIILCLWNAALYGSARLCAKTGTEKPDIKNMIISNSNSSEKMFSPSLRSSSESSKLNVMDNKAGDSHHKLCPHWSHCGPRLAVFDLQRILAVLKDVMSQPAWNAVLSEAGTESPLLEDTTVIMSSIEDCLVKAATYLSCDN